MTIKHMSPVMSDKGSLAIYGLGEDNRVYRWDYMNYEWNPYWDTRTQEEKDAPRQQFNSNPQSPRNSAR